jgi:hypothetical protein
MIGGDCFEVLRIDLKDETLQVDGNFALTRMGQIDFSVEKFMKGIIGISVSEFKGSKSRSSISKLEAQACTVVLLCRLLHRSGNYLSGPTRAWQWLTLLSAGGLRSMLRATMQFAPGFTRAS